MISDVYFYIIQYYTYYVYNYIYNYILILARAWSLVVSKFFYPRWTPKIYPRLAAPPVRRLSHLPWNAAVQYIGGWAR